MQLPYPAPLPSWTKHGHPCIVSRPLTTVQSNLNHLVPRLYPVQLSSRPVIPVNFNYPSALKPHNGQPENILSNMLVSARSPEWNNNMKALPFDCGDATIVTCTTTGKFGDMALWQITLDESETVDYFTPLRSRNISTQFSARAQEHVKTISAVSKDPVGGVLAACCSNSICIGLYDTTSTYLDWIELIDVRNAFDCDLNSLCQDEIAVLDQNAVKVFDLVRGASNCVFQADLQPLSPHAVYRWMHYAAHPRTLHTSSRNQVARLDLRCGSSSDRADVIFKPHTNWDLPAIDRGISFFTSHPSHPFRSILTTDSLLAVLDSRMLNIPLLEWNISLDDDLPVVSVTALSDGPDADFVIAVSSRFSDNLLVFHATSCSAATVTPLSLQEPAQTWPSKTELFGTQPVWSDMPLAHLDKFMPGLHNRGVALVPHRGGSRISLVQSSLKSGIRTQLLGCEMFTDGCFRFEPSPKLETSEQHLLHGIDSAVNILNTRDSMLTCSSFDLEGVRHELLRDFEPGNRALANLSCLDARDSVTVRESILDR